MPLQDQNRRLEKLIEKNAQTLRQMQDLLTSLENSTTQTTVLLAQDSMAQGAIVVVDDDSADAFLTRRTIERLKLQNPLHFLANGDQLVSYLKGSGIYQDRNKYPYPVLLLLDLKMPGMDGFDVLDWLRKHPRHSSIPVVVLSGLEELREVNRAYLMGAHSYLSKPVNASDFQTVVKKLAIAS